MFKYDPPPPLKKGYRAAGPESMVLFSKRCTFGLKSVTKSLVRRYQAKFAKIVPDHLKVCHIFIKSKKKTYVIFFIHIIQLSLFTSEYSPIAGK